MMLYQQVIKAVCWMLVHSLWMGVLMVVIANITMTLTRRSPAALRYNLMLGVLLSFVLATGAVFCYYLFSPLSGSGYAAVPLPGEQGPVNVAPVGGTSPGTLGAIEHWWVKCGVLLDKYAVWIFMAWFAVILFKSARLIGGLRYIAYMKHHQLTEVPAFWKRRTGELAQRMSVKYVVQLYESALVKAPLTIGFLKPFILFPVGALTGLAQDEVESILIHELTHIRRNDYLVNILQEIISIIFFFNPALLWFSALIREEREHCCDDEAVKYCGDNIKYIRVLLSFHSQQAPDLQYAAAVTGRKGQTLNRVKRLLNNEHSKSNIMEKIISACCVLLIVLLGVTYSTVGKPRLTTINENAMEANRDTTPPATKKSLTTADSGKAAAGVTGALGTTVETAITATPSENTAPAKQERDPMIDSILKDLVAAGVIKDKEDPSFKLSDEELVVKGVKQPAALHKRLKARYGITPEKTILHKYTISL